MSQEPLAATTDLSVVEPGFRRDDLIFSEVDHSGPSYQVLVHLVGLDEKGDAVAQADAGSFYVFGHGSCFGDEGHCDVRGPISAYDYRRPHQLTPTTSLVVATEAVRTLIDAGATQFRVEATPVVKQSPFAKPEDAQNISLTAEVELRVYTG